MIEESPLGDLDIPAGGRKTFHIPFEIKTDAEYCINLYFTLRDSTIYAVRGFEVCRSQILYKCDINLSIDTSIPADTTEIEYDGRYARLTGNDFQIVFDRLTGELKDWFHKGVSLLDRGFRPNFFRAATDNDKAKMRKVWLNMGLDRMTGRTESFEIHTESDYTRIDTISIQSAIGKKPLFRVKSSYLVYSDGKIDLDMDFEPLRETDYLPKIGSNFKIPLTMQHMKWYGRGPHESYIDKCQSALLGVYSGDVADQLEPYEFPQESGNKLDTRWMSFSDTNGNSIMVISTNPISAGALLYSAEELDRAMHLKDLEPDGSICVNLDIAQNAIGNHSCGPEPLEKYRLYPRKSKLNLRLVPYNKNECSEEEVYTLNTLII